MSKEIELNSLGEIPELTPEERQREIDEVVRHLDALRDPEPEEKQKKINEMECSIEIYEKDYDVFRSNNLYMNKQCVPEYFFEIADQKPGEDSYQNTLIAATCFMIGISELRNSIKNSDTDEEIKFHSGRAQKYFEKGATIKSTSEDYNYKDRCIAAKRFLTSKSKKKTPEFIDFIDKSNKGKYGYFFNQEKGKTASFYCRFLSSSHSEEKELKNIPLQVLRAH